MVHRTPAFCIVLVALSFIASGAKQPAASETKKAESAVAKKAAAAPAKEAKAAAKPFKDEPAARALYDKMIETMRKVKSLSYVSRLSSQWNGEASKDRIYRAWLKKPNYFRVQADSTAAKNQSREAEAGARGVLIGDGATLWIYWPQGRRKDEWEDAKHFEKTRLTSYMTKPAPPGGHSIGHRMCDMGPRPILDPSTFFGYTDSLQPYLDGVKGLGTEKVGSEECDKIELSFMKHQRSWFLWLSKRDHVPRKLKEIVRVNYELVENEDWSSVIVNANIPDNMFAWKPPKAWTEWKEPPWEIGLLKPGAKAPDFNLASADGTRIKLSDFRGQVVWFYVWRAG